MRHLLLATVLGLAAPVARASTEVVDVRPAAAPVRDAPRLEVGVRRAAFVTAAALALWGAAAVERAVDDVESCRWCEPGQLDRWGRRELRWSDPGAAGGASDVFLYGTTFGSAAAVAWLAGREGGRRELLEDVFLVAAVGVVTDALTRGTQHATGRVRPYALDGGEPRRDRELQAFFSGHASRSFAAAAAATQIARLRGRRGWPWVAAVGFTAAGAAAWLRVAADQHWVTDVLAGAGVGTAVGWAIPALALRPAAGATAWRIVPAPGGVAVLF